MKTQYKILLSGISLFLATAFVFFQKISNNNFRTFSGGGKADMFDGYFGFLLLFIIAILASALISHSLKLNIRLSNLGEYLVKLFERIKNIKR